MENEIPEKASCLTCSYQLRGLSQPICPECGRPFDPQNPHTYKDLNTPWALSHWATPPPLWHIIPIAAFTALRLLARSRVEQAFNSFTPILGNPSLKNYIALMIVCLFSVLYVLHIVAYLRARKFLSAAKARPSRSRRWRWAITPLCTALIVSAFIIPWPLRLRFTLSKNILEQTAQSILNRTPTNTSRQYMGLYRVHFVSQTGLNRVIFTTGTYKGAPAGLMYDPTLATDPDGPDLFRLSDNWYVFGWQQIGGK